MDEDSGPVRAAVGITGYTLHTEGEEPLRRMLTIGLGAVLSVWFFPCLTSLESRPLNETFFVVKIVLQPELLTMR